MAPISILAILSYIYYIANHLNLISNSTFMLISHLSYEVNWPSIKLAYESTQTIVKAQYLANLLNACTHTHNTHNRITAETQIVTV